MTGNIPLAPAGPALQAPAVLLMGAVGSGKTHSIVTLGKAGLEVFAIVTEPTGLDTLLDAWQKEKLEISKLHYAVINPARVGFKGLLSIAQKVSKLNFEGLAKLQPSGDREHSQWLKLLAVLCDFKDDRTGELYGPVEDFDATRAVVVDSMSGLNLMAMDITIGDKASAHQGEWGVAMGLIEKLIHNLTSNLKCMFVLTAHLEREANDTTGAIQIMASTLGKKLAPKIPRFFSEVVMAERTDKGYTWSTKAFNVDLKNRSLPLGDGLSPSFLPIIEAYRRRVSFTTTSTPGVPSDATAGLETIAKAG